MRAVYPALLDRRPPARTRHALANAIAAAAEGYPFPTNLDLDQPVDGLTPPSQAELVTGAGRALDAGPADELRAGLTAYAARRDGPP